MSSNNGAAHPSPKNRLAPPPKPPLEVRKEEAVAALHEQFDKLNALWTEKEKELVSMHVPTKVWYNYKSEENEYGPHINYYIGLAKWRGQWRLLHSTEFVGADDTDDCPLVEASLEYRLEAAEHFDKLRENLIDTAEQSVAKVQDAIAALSR